MEPESIASRVCGEILWKMESGHLDRKVERTIWSRKNRPFAHRIAWHIFYKSSTRYSGCWLGSACLRCYGLS